MQNGSYERPKLTYVQLIKEAIESSPTQQLSLKEIYESVQWRYPYYATSATSWKNVIRHCLSITPAFQNLPREDHNRGKGGLWYVDSTKPDVYSRKRTKRRDVRRPSVKTSPSATEPMSPPLTIPVPSGLVVGQAYSDDGSGSIHGDWSPEGTPAGAIYSGTSEWSLSPSTPFDVMGTLAPIQPSSSYASTAYQPMVIPQDSSDVPPNTSRSIHRRVSSYHGGVSFPPTFYPSGATPSFSGLGALPSPPLRTFPTRSAGTISAPSEWSSQALQSTSFGMPRDVPFKGAEASSVRPMINRRRMSMSASSSRGSPYASPLASFPSVRVRPTSTFNPKSAASLARAQELHRTTLSSSIPLQSVSPTYGQLPMLSPSVYSTASTPNVYTDSQPAFPFPNSTTGPTSALGLSISSSKDQAPERHYDLPTWSSSARHCTQPTPFEGAHQPVAPVFASYAATYDHEDPDASGHVRPAHPPQQQRSQSSRRPSEEPMPFLQTQTGEFYPQPSALMSSPPWYHGGSI